MQHSEKQLAHYLALPYSAVIVPDDDGEGYHAAIRELKGCMAFGETVEAAYAALQEVRQIWLETALARGWRIPEPNVSEDRSYSGEFRVRLPQFLHRDLAQAAEREGTSLNQLVVALLSEGVARLQFGGALQGDTSTDVDAAQRLQSAPHATPVAVSEPQTEYGADEETHTEEG
jgi:antitoxin HicB